MEVLKVVGYNRDGDFHICTDERGERQFVDLLMDLRKKLNEGIDPMSLVGKSVTAGRTFAYILIAQDVVLDAR